MAASEPEPGAAADPGEFTRTDVEFRSAGERCAAWLYRPEGADRGAPVPLIVVAHGFGMVREAGLDRYAERSAAAGFGALVFDYRHFGASGGMPRELLDIDRQLEDWRAAIEHGRQIDWVDPDRVALWGSSFSGGHVVRLASEDVRIVTVVSQVPFSGTGRSESSPRRSFVAKLIFAALRDRLAATFGRGPVYLPVTAAPGTPCLFEVPPGADPLAALLPEGEHSWRNRFTPRVLLALPGYKPFEAVGRIDRPWMLSVCDRDSVTPAERAVERAGASSGLVLRRYPIDHFEIYSGEWFERAVGDQVEFLRAQLTV